jgi:hypothetical protein
MDEISRGDQLDGLPWTNWDVAMDRVRKMEDRGRVPLVTRAMRVVSSAMQLHHVLTTGRLGGGQ